MLAKLTDVCDIQYGYAFDSAQFSETEGIPLVRIRDIVRGFSETCTTESFPEEYLVHDGDILIGMDGEFNIARWHGGTAALNQRVCRLIPQRINSEYIFHFMPSALKAIENKTPFVTVKHLSAKELNRIMVPIPVIDEQIRIGNTLNEVGGIIEARQQQLRAFDTLIKARFVEMFGIYPANEKGWSTGTIRDLVTEVRYGSSRKAAEGTSGQFPYLRMNNITYNGELDLSDTKTIDVPEEELDKCTVRRGDLLFNRTNSKELVGKTCVYNRDERMVLAGFVVRVRLNEKVLPEFVSAFMNTDFSKQMLLNMCKAAIGQANINAQELQNIGIYIPPISLQKEFVCFKDQIDKSKVVVQAALDKAQLLFNSLMQQYFG